MDTKLLKRLGTAVTVISFAASFFVLAGFFKGHGTQGIISGFFAISPGNIAMSFVFTALSYFFLIFSDYLAVRYTGHKLPFRKYAAVSFTANAFGNSLGLSILSSSAVRLRLYSLWDFSVSEIGRIIAFCGVSEITGFAALSAILLDLNIWPGSFHPFVKYASFAAAIILLLILLSYLIWASFYKKTYAVLGNTFRPPGAPLAALQVLVSALDWFFAAAAFYVLIQDPSLTFTLFFASYLASEILSIISNVPGGFGVFDAAAISLMSMDKSSGTGVISAVIFFRIIYFFIPLAVSYIVYGLAEAESARKNIFSKAGEIKDLLSSTPGYIFSFFAFITGSVSLLICSIPALQPRAAMISGIMPLFLSESASLLAALCCAGLIMLTRGLQKNIYSSYVWSLALLVSIALFLLVQSFSYEASFLIFLLFGIMLFFRDSFYRRTGPFTEKPTTGLLFVTAAVMAFCALIAYLSGGPENIYVSRGVRSLVVSGIALAAWIVINIFKPYKPMPHASSDYDIHTASKIAFNDPDTTAQLALSGDKKMIFSWSRLSFLMYAQCGDHFVALGDPVGPYVEMEELIWKFKKMALQNKGTPAFFNTTDDNLHFYDDSGFNFYKIGEEAKIALESYPQNKKNGDMLAGLSLRMQAQGFSFRVFPKSSNTAVIKETAPVSSEWLRTMKIKEPGFIIGSYSRDYLKNFSIAAVYKNNRLFAFANIFASNDRDEFRIDMLRHLKGAPDDFEEYFNCMLVQWGMENHFAFFNLGLAPLAGPELNSFSPSWKDAGAALYNHGARFQSSKALRDQKEKLGPSWHPRYLVCANFMDVPSILSEISLLTTDKKQF
jgi:phosphatidylglycerol lysyltransferase